MNVLLADVNSALLGTGLKNRLAYVGNAPLEQVHAYIKVIRQIKKVPRLFDTTERCVQCPWVTVYPEESSLGPEQQRVGAGSTPRKSDLSLACAP